MTKTFRSNVRLGVLALGVAVGLGTAIEPSLAGQAKPFVRITEEQARAAMATAIAAAKGNDLTLSSTFQKELKKIWSDYENKGLLVYDRRELQVQVVGGAQYLVQQAVSKMTTSQQPTNLVWAGGVSIVIAPFNAQAPNVVETTVTRGTEVIKPLKMNLVETSFSTGGATGEVKQGGGKVHEGNVVYPNSAFDPDVNVKVEAVLDSGRKLGRTFIQSELRKVN